MSAAAGQLDEEAPGLVGTVVSERYRIERVLGEGGMGTVYEASHVGIGRRVALKTLLPELASNPTLVARFHREAKAASTIGHEHIVDVLDMGSLDDGAPFLVMELLQGRELAELVDDGPLPIGRAVRILLPVCSALAAAHDAGIVHRDLKPANIFLVHRPDGSDFPKVLDFGISKACSDDHGLTKTGTALGTPAYMSPEQAQGLKSVDHRTDVYAVGAILFELLSGGPPFTSRSYASLLLKVMMEPVPSLRSRRKDVPEALEAVVARALAKEPEDRFATVRELERALSPFSELNAPRATPTPRPPGAGSDPRPKSARTQMLEPDPAEDETLASGDVAPRDVAPTGIAQGTTAQEGTARQDAPALPVRRLSPLAVGAVVGLLGLTAVGAMLALAEGGPAQADERTAPEIESSGVSLAPARAPGLEQPPAPPEVRVRVSVNPSEAVIYLGGARFTNPMNAMHERSLAPTQLRVECEGYETVERRVLLNGDRSFDFEMLALRPPAQARRRAARPASPARRHPPAAELERTPPTTNRGLRSDF